SLVKKSCNEIEDICNGIFLLRELTSRTKDRIGSYGELISSQIIAAKFNADGVNSTWKDSRQLILTNSIFTAAEVDYAETNERVSDYFQSQPSSLFILPGFIASDKNEVTT